MRSARMIEHSKVYWFNLIRSVVISLPVFAALSFAMIAPARAAEQMNVVFILADDLGWSDLACYGPICTSRPTSTA